MKYIVIVLVLLAFRSVNAQEQPLISYVRPLVGTSGYGNIYPGSQIPFGGIQISPDTDFDYYDAAAGYKYDHTTLLGFSLTHLSGTGIPDLGDFLFMPGTGKIYFTPGTHENPDAGYRSRYSHEREWASPNYYGVELLDYGVKAEMTSGVRSGMLQFTYPASDSSFILLDLNHTLWQSCPWSNIRVENDSTLTGYKLVKGWGPERHVYFTAVFSRPFENFGIMQDTIPVVYNTKRFRSHLEAWGADLRFWMQFPTCEGETVTIKVAISSVSTQGPVNNIRELEGKNFATLKVEGEKLWEDQLSKFVIEGSQEQKETFYTSVYHTFLHPFIFQDADGRFRELDKNIGEAKGFTNYTVFSLWDTYRALHPLFNLFYPSRSKDIIASFLKHYQQSVHGALPIWSHMANENWCMIGYHGVSVVADAYVKGIEMDEKLALEAVMSNSTIPYLDGLKEYMELGYVPMNKSGNSASVTLEYGYDDWTIYNMARLMGKQEVADKYLKRAAAYKYLVDEDLGFIRPKDSVGKWKANFDVLDTHGQGFIEGNSWNYSFYVPQDVNGVKIFMGGDKRFIERLDSLFTMELPAKYYENTEDITKEGLMGNYVHGNEPSQHIPYLYMWTSQPWKTQYRLREIMDRMYRNNIDGLCGNDDCGQMSAWYIFTAMGFYPVCPGSDQYVLGAPYLKEMTVHLENGKDLVIKAPKVSAKNRYVKSVKLNGREYDKAYLTHQDICNGGELFFEMSSTPNKKRVFTEEQKPYSMTK